LKEKITLLYLLPSGQIDFLICMEEFEVLYKKVFVLPNTKYSGILMINEESTERIIKKFKEVDVLADGKSINMFEQFFGISNN